MKNKITQTLLIALLMVLTSLTTCSVVKNSAETKSTMPDKLLQKQWEQQKQEKENIVQQFTAKLSVLEKSNDSLRKQVNDKKLLLSANRSKAKAFEITLKQEIVKADSCGAMPETIIPLIDSLALANAQNDTLCDQTIGSLVNILANRDSSILLHENIEASLRDIQRDQELRNRDLTEQLNIAFKTQRKKARQNKFLAGGLLILTGITSSLLITHSLK